MTVGTRAWGSLPGSSEDHGRRWPQGKASSPPPLPTWPCPEESFSSSWGGAGTELIVRSAPPAVPFFFLIISCPSPFYLSETYLTLLREQAQVILKHAELKLIESHHFFWENMISPFGFTPGSGLEKAVATHSSGFSCLENPRDGGAWWAAVYGVAQSRTRLKRLSSSSWKWFLQHWLFPRLKDPEHTLHLLSPPPPGPRKHAHLHLWKEK